MRKTVAAVVVSVGAVALLDAKEAARADDPAKIRVAYRLCESYGTARRGPGGTFRVRLRARGLSSDPSKLFLSVGDAEVLAPLRRGRFNGRVPEQPSVRGSVLARRGRVHARFQGVAAEDGLGQVFGRRAFETCDAESHWDGTFFSLEEGRVVFDETTVPLAVGVAGRSDWTRFRRNSPESFRVALSAVGRSVLQPDEDPVVAFVPSLPNEPWTGRLRGQVLVTDGGARTLALRVDGGAATRVDPSDVEALDLGEPIHMGAGTVVRNIGSSAVVQMRFDTLVPALPGPHVARIEAGSEASAERTFVAPDNDPPLVLDVDGHAVEVRADGLVWAWGDNHFGEIGNGLSLRNPLSPVPLTGPTGAVHAAAGENFSLAVDGEGTTWLWGRYDDNTTPFRSFPEVFPGLPTVVSVAAGGTHGLALDADGQVWSFGSNAYGQLGDGTYKDRFRDPRMVGGLPQIVAVAAGHQTSLALAADGRVFTWGEQNLDGIGTALRPFRVRGIPKAVAVSVKRDETSNDTLVLAQDGTVWAWGGVEPSDAFPSQVSGLPEVSAISCGGHWHDLALARDGTVWAWGLKTDLFGVGTLRNAEGEPPVQVPGLARIVRIAAGEDASLAIDADGATWIFGDSKSAFLDRWPRTSNVPVLAPRPFRPGNTPAEADGAKPR